jgi:hypothetical protein
MREIKNHTGALMRTERLTISKTTAQRNTLIRRRNGHAQIAPMPPTHANIGVLQEAVMVMAVAAAAPSTENNFAFLLFQSATNSGIHEAPNDPAKSEC